MQILIKGKPVSRKQAEELVGKERMDKRVEEAKETHAEDPLTEISWMDGMEITFE